MKNKTFEIDITPSWRFVVKSLFAVLQSHLKKSLKPEDQWTIRKELLKCSDVADKYNEDASLMAKGYAKLIEDQKYNGYTNKVTHTIMSMIDNDEGTRSYIMDWAKVCLFPDEETATKNGHGIIELADFIKDYMLDEKPEQDQYNESMLSWAYAMVNWEEIADHVLDAVKEEKVQ